MHDVVVDALGRIDAAEEAAAMDREPKRRKGRPSSPPWAIESEIIGYVQQSDIPKLLMDEIAKLMPIRGGISMLARELNLFTTTALRNYTNEKSKMPYTTGQRFVRYLEERAKKSGAAPVAAGTTPKQKATEEAPAAIVPQQPANDMEALHAELNCTKTKLQQYADEITHLKSQILEVERANDTLNTALNTATAKLASVQGREMTELEDEVETLRRRVAHYEADDAACGPARVEELEDRLSRIQDERVRDLELIRDLTRTLVARGAC